MILLSEEEIYRGMRALLLDDGLVTEGGGAVAVAALLAGKVKLTGPAALVISGRNVDMGQLLSDRQERAGSTRINHGAGLTMRDIFVLTEADLRRCVTIDLEAIRVVEEAFRMLASGKVIMPPILSMEIPEAHGEVDVKTAYIPGFDGFAIKVSPGFFDNPKIGLPSLNGLMILFSAKTGLVEALLLDNGYLTDVRTAAAGAVAARHLAPADHRNSRCTRHRRAGTVAGRGGASGAALQAGSRLGQGRFQS